MIEEVQPTRDPRVEDPTNLWVVHPSGRALLPHALRLGISANAVSVIGLVIGAGAAVAYHHWADAGLATLGFLLTIGWLIADGLDGMVARATGSASPLGRVLDGICDHGVFACLYTSLALSIGGLGTWVLAFSAAIIHGLQASLYEGERARYHRRLRGEALVAGPSPHKSRAVRFYDLIANSMDRVAAPFERRLAQSTNGKAFAARYAARAVPPMKLLALLSGNVRVISIFIACLAGDPRYFWWFEITALSAIAISGILWHRRVERLLINEDASVTRW
jgi:phosphatidylglycerophosphate synthase